MVDEWDFANTFSGPQAGPGMCAKCHERPATEKYVAELGVMGLTHGQYQMWCKRCVVRAQVAYAKDRAASLVDLEAKLAELEGQP